jgi:hypothetical protein
MTEEQIRARIEALEKERQQLMEAANQRLAQIAGELKVWGEVLGMIEPQQEADDGE